MVLPCRANGLPSPRIRWEKDGQPISGDDNRFRILRSGWLAIPLARQESYNYACVILSLVICHFVLGHFVILFSVICYFLLGHLSFCSRSFVILFPVTLSFCHFVLGHFVIVFSVVLSLYSRSLCHFVPGHFVTFAILFSVTLSFCSRSFCQCVLGHLSSPLYLTISVHAMLCTPLYCLTSVVWV